MSRIPLSLRFIFIFTGFGFVFSAYLLLAILFLGRDALSEAAQLVFGLPAFSYGLTLFTVLLAIAFYVYKQRVSFERGVITVIGVSFLGIVFSAFVTFIELPTLLKHGFSAYTFGVPTSFIDLVFFMLDFVTATIVWSYNREHNR